MDGLGQGVLAQPQGLHPVFQQNFAGMGKGNFAGHGFSPSAVIDDFNVRRLAGLETKTDAPLVIDANAPLPGAVARKFFQTIAGRHTQEIQRHRGVKLLQLANGDALDGDESRHTQTTEQAFGVGAAKTRNHRKSATAPVISVKRHDGIWATR
jgi:hypothetical protein